jgi:hypothetical protein
LVAAVVPMQMLLQLLQLQTQMLQLQKLSKFRAFSDLKTSPWEVFLFVSVALVSFEPLA